MKLVFLVVVLLLLPFVSAFDCSLVDDSDSCEEIKSSSLSEDEKEQFYSTLLYQENSVPTFNEISDYNHKIIMDTAPDETLLYNSQFIKNAWFSFSALSPSVYENDLLYVPLVTETLTHFGYDIELPEDYRAGRYPREKEGYCKIRYNLEDENSNVKYYLNGRYKGNGQEALLHIDASGDLKAQLNIKAKVRTKYYRWKEHTFWKWTYYSCRYSHSNYQYDNLKISERREVILDTQRPDVDVQLLANYGDTTKGNFTGSDYSQFEINFPESSLIKQEKTYHLVFEKQPYHIAYFQVQEADLTSISNLNLYGNYFFVKNADECSISSTNHFYSVKKECDQNFAEEELDPLEIEEKKLDLTVLIYILLFLFLFYLFYRIIKLQCKKIIIPVLFLLLFIPVVHAEPEECGLTNLASCIPNVLYDFILMVINAPLIPLLAMVQKLLISDASFDVFFHLWSIIRYMLSFFYIFFILYAGYVLLTSNAEPMKRAYAKELLRNMVLMVILIQGSFYIYELLVNLSSNMSLSIISYVNPEFFILTVDNLINIGLELIFNFTYMLTLFLTVLFLIFRYIVVSIGVFLFPIGLFCYFVPPLKGYGKFIINLLGMMIFVTFFDLLIILACSMLIDISLFANVKILVMIVCFGIVNYTLWLATKFAIKKSTSGSLKDDLHQAVKYVALLV